MDSPSSPMIDVTGNMDIPSAPGLSSPSTTIPGFDASAAQATSSLASSFLARKLWSGYTAVKELPFVKSSTTTGRQNMRSWFEFFNAKKFKKPALSKLVQKDYYTDRLFRNVQYFHVNYICVFLVLFLYCVLTSPLLLIALFISCGAFYYAHMKNTVRKLAFAGHEITLFHQYCVIGALSLILFYYTGAGNAFMWVLGASLFFILLHAAFFGIEDEGQEFAFQLEEV